MYICIYECVCLDAYANVLIKCLLVGILKDNVLLFYSQKPSYSSQFAKESAECVNVRKKVKEVETMCARVCQLTVKLEVKFCGS